MPRFHRVRRGAFVGLLGVTVALAACATPGLVCPAAAPTVVVPPIALAQLPPLPPYVEEAARDTPCFARGRPSARPAKKDERAYCQPLDAAEVARVEARIKKDLPAEPKPAKLVVDFGCDAAFGTTKELFFEDGSGHGGTLRIVRFRSEGARVAVRVIASSHYRGTGVELLDGWADKGLFDAAVERARVAMLARPHVVALRATDGSIGLGSMSFSSNDFHLRLSIIDEEGHVTDQGFTGYESSDEQRYILPMRYATEPVQKLLETISLAPQAPTDEDRVFFTERFIATMDGRPYWWVVERYVALAKELGTVDALPALAARVRESGSGSKDRTREAAIDAIAAITGWDPRAGAGSADGGARSVDEAAAAVAKACTTP